jgi:galactose-1-phosphate uridylyltransferase
VVVAPGRSTRPGAGAAVLEPQTEEELDSCPFCEGREDRTPPEVLGLPRDRAPDTPGWRVRVVPNKYPAFDRQEVVIHAPEHVRSIAELDREQLELVAEAWRVRAEAAREAGQVLFAVINEGRAAGSSLPHSHSQLVWLDANGFGPRLGAALDLAAQVLRRLAEDAPRPMNLWLHESGHWHLELVPRLTVFAALELGAGYFVNTIAPEEAAAQLRR